MDTFEKQYRFKEKELLCYINSILLSELIFLNYSFSNKEYNGIGGKEIWKIIESKHIFSTKEKNSIIKNAMILLNIKYNIKLEENLVSQFERLDIEKE